MRNIRNDRGSALLLIIIIMSMFIALATTASSLIISELRINKDMADAVVAFYAADSAIEKVLIEARQEPTPMAISDATISIYMPVADDYAYATATVEIIDLIVGVSIQSARIQSNGHYKETNRAIEVTQPI
jgi:Tfp pilus assembly protein PilX